MKRKSMFSTMSASAIALLGMSALGAQTATAETRWYAIGMQHLATYSDAKFGPGTNCPKGGNGAWSREQIRILKTRYNYSEAQAKAYLAKEAERKTSDDLIGMRGIKDGKPAPILHYPLSIPKTEVELVVPHGKAYGFNLDGTGASKPDAMTDPETGATDVQNRLFRILGCYGLYDTNLPIRPVYEESVFIDALAVMPAWLISLTGDDLSKDGPVTVKFAKALKAPQLGADGKPLRGQTFTLDTSNRSFGTLQGKIVGDQLTAQGGEISLEGETPMLTVWNMTSTQLRLSIHKDGSLGGYIGGFEPWVDYWFMQTGSEAFDGADLSTAYWNMKELADADPDPVTGQNRRISATYRLDDLMPVVVLPAPDNYRAPVNLRAKNLKTVNQYVKGGGYGSADTQVRVAAREERKP
jgi:hypothetical protein